MAIEFTPFSPKQLAVLTWWCAPGVGREKNGVICDGAVRSGKTLCMSVSFVAWAFYRFENTAFAICGKTVASLRRNVISPILPVLGTLGFTCREKVSKNYVDIARDGKTNRFYLFGGKDEGSASLIQGMTLGGILLDEVALMPRSFVEQAVARCSLSESKFWFNCNPEHPKHWFHEEWILKCAEKNMIYLHFTMEDNPSLSPRVVSRYKSLYSGAFYERFIEGKWVAAQGLVYPMFDPARHVCECRGGEAYYLSCDYGTVNPFSLGLWTLHGGVWYRIREYYHDSRAEGVQLTDEEYYEALERLSAGCEIRAVVIDPSAASFIQCIKKHGKYAVIRADNDVAAGISRVCDALRSGEIRFSAGCRDTIREFSLYRWDDSARRDAPRKENDHAMDDIRYFAATVLDGVDGGCYSIAVERG